MLAEIIARYRKQFVLLGWVTGLIIVFGVVWYIGTHGFVSLDNTTQTNITLVPIQDGFGDGQAITNGEMVKSGRYVVRNDQDGRMRIAIISVPGWLQTAKLRFEDAPNHQLHRVASLTSGVILGQQTALKSYDDTAEAIQALTTHPQDDPFGLNAGSQLMSKQLAQPQLFNNSTLVGLSTGDGEDTEGYDRLAMYNVDTDSFTRLGNTSFLTQDPTVMVSQSLNGKGVVVYDAATKKYTYYTENSQKDLNIDGPVAFDGKAPILDLNQDTLAVLVGNNYISPSGDSEHPNTTQNDTHIDFYNLSSGKKIRSLSLSKSNTIAQLSVSSDGAVAVLDNDRLWVYSSTGQLVDADPYSTTHDAFWGNSTQLYAVATDNSVSRFDLAKHQQLGLFTTTALSMNNAHLATDSRLYIGAFTSNNKGAQLPDGYVLDLNSPEHLSNSVIDKLPLETSDYKINISNNVITIQLTAYDRDGARNALFMSQLKQQESDARKALDTAVGGNDKLAGYTIKIDTY